MVLSNKMVLSMYDFSAKQNFIYKTNKIKEIVGASQLIKDAFSDFFCLLREIGFKLMNPECCFSIEKFEKEKYNCGVVYEGGGNLFMVFDTKENCAEANRKFSRMIYEKTYGLNLVCAYVDVTENFEQDREKLYEKSREIKENTPMMHPINVLPFTMIDRNTSLPVFMKKYFDDGSPEELSREGYLKLRAYETAKRIDPDIEKSEKHLDNLVEKKGSDSLLAIIYIDGNAMGEKVKNLFAGDDDISYDHRAGKLRDFSKKIDVAFQERPFSAIKEIVGKKSDSKLAFRKIIGGGDEITIICKASLALDIVDKYFETVREYKYDDEHRKNFSSCAGIAIFHSHDPFSAVYKIAEECCESGKKRNRDPNRDNDNFYVDFHYCRSGITGNLEDIRKHEEEAYTNRPYCWYSPTNNDPCHDFEKFVKVGETLKEMAGERARGDIKSLSESIFKGDSYFKVELERLRAKYGRSVDISDINEESKKEIFDACLIYDLWFKNEKTERNEEEKAQDEVI